MEIARHTFPLVFPLLSLLLVTHPKIAPVSPSSVSFVAKRAALNPSFSMNPFHSFSALFTLAPASPLLATHTKSTLGYPLPNSPRSKMGKELPSCANLAAYPFSPPASISIRFLVERSGHENFGAFPLSTVNCRLSAVSFFLQSLDHEFS